MKLNTGSTARNFGMLIIICFKLISEKEKKKIRLHKVSIFKTCTELKAF